LKEYEGMRDRLQMVLYGAMGFLICSLAFLVMVTVISFLTKKSRDRAGAGPNYSNLAATPIEFVRNPLDELTQKPGDKEKLIQ